MDLAKFPKYDTMEEELNKKYLIAGPLSLNLDSKQASTTFGANIPLSSQQFDTLHMLARQEGEAVANEAIIQAIYINDTADVATDEISQLVSKINSIGHEFMRIEQAPTNTGINCFTFITNWGRNYNKSSESVDKFKETTDIIQKPLNKPRRFDFRKHKATYASMATAAALGLGLIWTMSSRPEMPMLHNLDDEQVPLIGFDTSPDTLPFPTIANITTNEGKTTIFLENSRYDNATWLSFDILLADTSEILYTSEIFPAAAAMEATINTQSLPEGEHNAVLNIRAYRFTDFEVTATQSTEFTIKITTGNEGGMP